MNRTIKFRTWDTSILATYDGSKGKMRDNEYIQSCCGYYILSDDKYPQRVIMQFTGLLDKNGKEIYEADIFKHETQSPFINDAPFETEIGIVEWGLWCYMYGFVINKPSRAFDRLKARQVEIIGNIFENKNLLNQ